MVQNPIGGFLKGLFGRQAPAASQPTQGHPDPALEAPPASSDTPKAPRATPLPTSDAYLNRKKGRKTFRESYADAKKLHESIQRRGEASPGDLAQESGMARSSLAYHLNRLAKYGYIERFGGGRSIRYKVTGKPLGRID